MARLISVSSVCNFPEKPWLQQWIVRLMKGEYADWEKGTEPGEVRTEAQQIGVVFHLLVQKRLGHTPTAMLDRAAAKAMLDQQILGRAYHAFDLWQAWYGSLQEVVVEHVEYDMPDQELGVIGRCDAILLIQGKRTVCEWKTGNDLHEADALEVSAYAWLANRNLKQRIDRALLVHTPVTGSSRIVALEPSAIVHGAAVFASLVQGKQSWNTWNILCHTGLKIGG